MAASKNTIARMAFSHLGGTARVEDIDTEQTAEAAQAKLWYDEARRTTLAEHDWGFARKRQALALSSEAPPDEWSFKYKVPTDMVAARRVENPVGSSADDPPFEIESGADDTQVILTDVDEAVLVYTRDVQATDLFTPHFTLALSYLWAHLLAAPTTGKRDKKADMMQFYLGTLERAGARDANQVTRRPPRDASWIEER